MPITLTNGESLLPPVFDDKFTVAGKISWLWMNSPLHRDWNISLLTHCVLPAVENGQYLLLQRQGLPIAYCSWAFLDLEAEMHFLKYPSHLRLDQWTSGDRMWFVDWVAPFGAADSRAMKKILLERFPDQVARGIRVRRNGSKTARVMEFRGRGIALQQAQSRLTGYYEEIVHSLGKSGVPLALAA